MLDLGLAKMRNAPDASETLAGSQAISISVPGMILGTVAYMSPEQAAGKEVDRTSDIWAFGCVLYEMLTRHRAFEGETATDVLGAVLRAEPDWHRLPPKTPETICRLLRRCLRKDSRLRLRDIGDARIEIDEAQSPPPTDRSVPRLPVRHRRSVWIVTLVFVALASAAATFVGLRRVPPPSEMRLEITTPPSNAESSFAISPDGRKMVFAALSEGQSRLWLRPLDSVSAQPLAGTEGGEFPFWSPDSHVVGFFADGKLKRIDIDSSAVQELVTSGAGSTGGTWSHDNVILFGTAVASPIFRVPATGGSVTAVTRLESEHHRHLFPKFLPDGNHFLYYADGPAEARGVYVGQLDGSTSRRLLEADATPVYASTGHLLFVRQRTLFAQGFDPVRLILTGSPSPVAEGILEIEPIFHAALSVSDAGPIAFRSGSANTGQRQLIWVDRSGKEVAKGEPDEADVHSPSISPDGRRVVLQRTVRRNSDLWFFDLAPDVDASVGSHSIPPWSLAPIGRRMAAVSRSPQTAGANGMSTRNGRLEPAATNCLSRRRASMR